MKRIPSFPTQIYRIMYSSENLYQTKALPHGESLKYPKNLNGSGLDGKEVGGFMLLATGLNHFYYVRDFTDMRCKHSRVLSIISERLHWMPVMRISLVSSQKKAIN